MKRTEVSEVLKSPKIGEATLVKGWVRTYRSNRFIAINDGSTINNLQAVINFEEEDENELKRITTGAAIEVLGELVESQGRGQSVELVVTSFKIIGDANPEEYPLQPKKHSLEYLREIAHLRPRTNTFAAVLRVRHAMTFAIHQFFNDKGFYNIHSPLITGTDAEGAGEAFQVTTLDLKDVPLTEDKEVDYKQDFFAKATSLAVTGQLEAELAALGLSKVYTFGPTFRAENSNTTRHLSEFWMIEPEVAFADNDDNMDLAEAMLKYCIDYALKNCEDDLQFLNNRILDEDKSKPQAERTGDLFEKLHFVADNDFVRITYTEAIDILRNCKPNKKKKFQFLINEWGADLQSEHERFLVEKHFKKPVIISDYPANIKAFYMKLNEDGKTVKAMDILFPGIGEIVGGSQREENYEVLLQKIEDNNIPMDSVWWYLDTRKYGTVPHAGYGLGFERLMLFITGMSNIRDVIPFPRTPKNAEF